LKADAKNQPSQADTLVMEPSFIKMNAALNTTFTQMPYPRTPRRCTYKGVARRTAGEE
jgi:hypothetical protein